MHSSGRGDFFSSVLDSLTEQIGVIDSNGRIKWVNRAWKDFSAANGGQPDKTWQATNYLKVCRNSQLAGDRDGDEALKCIEAVIRGEQPAAYLEYPCHSPTEPRWFMMRIRPHERDGPRHFVVVHQNITERKLAELRVEELAIIDGLTGIANRRRFDEFLQDEWRRALRLGHPVSLALLDIDFFKPYNDNYGHQAGDECLRRVAKALKAFCRRPGDLVARYGGEEFALILGNTEQDAACTLAEKIRAAIHALNIPHQYATRAACVTASIGVACLRPDSRRLPAPSELIEAADQSLYEAKRSGRNKVCAAEIAGARSDARAEA